MLKRAFFITIILATLLYLCVPIGWSQVANHPWPMYQHDPQHTGKSEYLGPQTNELKWSYNVYEKNGVKITALPVIDQNGRVYLGTTGGLLALTPLAHEAEFEWLYPTASDFISSLIAPDGTIYVLTYTQFLAVTPSGTLEWEAAIPPLHIETTFERPHLILEDNIIYFSSSLFLNGIARSFLTAFDAGNGSLLWIFDLDEEQRYSNFEDGDIPQIWVAAPPSTPCIGTDGNIYVGFRQNLMAVNTQGDLVWKKILELSENCQASIENITSIGSLCVDEDGIVYFAVAGAFYIGGPGAWCNWCGADIYAIDPYSINPSTTTLSTEEVKWNHPVGHSGFIFIGQNNIYVATSRPTGIECIASKFIYVFGKGGEPYTPLSTSGFSPSLIDSNENFYGIWGNMWVRAMGTDGVELWTYYSGGYPNYFGGPFALSAEGVLYAPTSEILFAFGTPAIGPDINLPEAQHDFGDVPVGEYADWNMAISNVGDADLVVDSINSDNAVFTVIPPDFPPTIPPDGSIDVTVRFLPSSAGNFTGTLTIVSNDPDEPEAYVAVAGTGMLVNQPPNQPTNIAPIAGATGVPLTPTLESSLFSDPDPDDTHTASQWEITTTPGDYSAPVYDSGVDNDNLTLISIPSGILAEATDYYWRVRHQDSYDEWSQWSEANLFTAFSSVGCAIIVTGKGGSWISHSFDFLIDRKAKKVYKSLRNMGFSDECIMYLNNKSQDADEDGDDDVDEDSTWDNFKRAVTEWAPRRVSSSSPFVLCMIGHARDTASFYLNSNDPAVMGIHLRGWFDAFPGEVKMLIVVDSCYAGSFITHNVNSLSSELYPPYPNRIIATSTRDDKNLSGLTNSFCSEFFEALQEGKNVLQSFIEGSERYILGVGSLRIPLFDKWVLGEPWLDDNGDREGSNRKYLQENPPNSATDEGWTASSMMIGTLSVPAPESEPLACAALCSPGELRMYDSEGRITGLVDGSVKEQIPDSVYIDDEEAKLIIVFSSVDTYLYKVVGTGAGTYDLPLMSIKNSEATTFAATDIPIVIGAVYLYTIDWDALSQGEEGVIIQIDFDGDGTFELNVTTGNTFVSAPATIDFDPDTLNLVSEGRWGTCYIELPNDHNVEDIDTSTVRLWVEGSHIPAEDKPITVGDYDADNVPDLMLKFSRSALIEILRNAGVAGEVSLIVYGQVGDAMFEGVNTITVIGTPAAPPIPTEFALFQNFSNPSNPDTWIPYQLAKDADVTIRIYDVSGMIIKTLNLGHKPAGFYTTKDKAAYWDGRNEAGEQVASGIYFYTIQAGIYTGARKMSILR